MAAMHEEEVLEEVECANCGTAQNLLKCSRCHTAWFCGVKCQKAYWPFHRTQCKRNDFADAIEEAEPKFARWMRKHGKQAVLKDDEVDRLEHAAQAACGPSREEVMDSMYGRADPKPLGPRYTAEDRAAMRREEDVAKMAARLALQRGGGPAYAAIEMPSQLSLDCQRYKWRQNQSHVELFVPLPEQLPTGRVTVQLTTSTISVVVDEAPVLVGRLYHEIKAEESTWFVQDGIVEVVMLKRCRRGHYEAGKTNADTFWRSVVQGAALHETLPEEHPPIAYYRSHCEGLKKEPPPRRLASGRAAQEAGTAAAAVPLTLTAA